MTEFCDRAFPAQRSGAPKLVARFRALLPVLSALLAVLTIWYCAVAPMNFDGARALADDGETTQQIILDTMSLDRPRLPAPHQIVAGLVDSILGNPIDFPRNLLYHAGVTAGTALMGFVLALICGIGLALWIVTSITVDRALMPWVVASQTIPVLAIAPMAVVVLGNLGFTGLLPKALIAAWLSFFPITAGMVKGLRSSDPMQQDLMRTYNASGAQIFGKLRWPASMAFLFPALRVSATLALVGAIVAELPTGAQTGLGARLLVGSYDGQTIQIWGALLMAAALALLCVGGVDAAQALLRHKRGGRL